MPNTFKSRLRCRALQKKHKLEQKMASMVASLGVNLLKKPAVLYHYPCPDGAFAALAAHLYFSSFSRPALFIPNTVHTPVRVEDLPLREISEIYLLDFVGPKGFVNDISSRVGRVVVLDHHKTAVEMFEADASIGENVTKVLDNERSGATIAYDYFSEKLVSRGSKSDLSRFERVRRLFEYIEDGDLWRWSLPHSKAFSSGLKDLKIEFSFQLNSSLFEQLLSLDVDSIINQGRESLQHKQKLIEETLAQSYEIALGGGVFGNCLAVDADSVSELRSELGHQLATKSFNLKLRGIGAVVYRVPQLENDRMLKISLRSLDREDTTPISQEYRGGGHRNASSFLLSSAEFEKWKV